MINEIILATNNKGKIMEMMDLLKDLQIEVKSLNDVFDQVMDIEEIGTTFEENAILKAETICEMLNKVVIADDSGLEIDALDKAPGILSARYLGHDTSYSYKNEHILNSLNGIQNRSARYVCSIALSIPNEETIVVTETMEGEIAFKKAGENGFGYDPIFYFPLLKKTAAQMNIDEKNKYSHRAKALLKIVEVIKEKKNG